MHHLIIQVRGIVYLIPGFAEPPADKRKMLHTFLITLEHMLCKIKTDIGCRVYVDGVLQGVAEVKELFKIPLEKGQYLVRYESIYDSTDYIERVITMVDSDIVEYASILPIIDRTKLILVPFKSVNGLWGYKELFSGMEMIGACFTEAYSYVDHTYAIVKQEQGFGVINLLGETVLSCQNDWVAYLSNDWFAVKQNGKWHLFHPTESVDDPIGEWVEWNHLEKRLDQYDDKYETIRDIIVINGKAASAIFSCKDGWFKFVHKFVNKGSISHRTRYDGYLEFFNSGRCGLLDKEYHVLVSCRYDEIGLFKNGVAIVSDSVSGKNLFGVINEKGEAIVPCAYEVIRDYHEGFACASRVDLDDDRRIVYGFLNTKGFEVIPFIYQGAADFSNGLARVIRKEFRGFINRTGEEILPVPWFTFHPEAIDSKFISGLLRTKSGGKTHGFINQQGEIVALEDTYEYDSKVESDDIHPLFPGYRMVKKDGLYGFVNNTGEVVIPIQYEMFGSPSSEKDREIGRKFAKKDGKWGYLDRYGKEVLPIVYDGYSIKDNDMVIVTQSKKKALFSLSGSQKTDFLFDDIGCAEERAFVYVDDQVGVIDNNGCKLVPFGLYKYRYSAWIDDWTQSVYYNGQPGFLLITNLRFYPSDKDHNDCLFDPESQVLNVIEVGALCEGEGVRRHHYMDAETGKTIVPECPDIIEVKRTSRGIIVNET